jgi:phospholysine phosphohistidine inorganic pyrophosphate phosphatase
VWAELAHRLTYGEDHRAAGSPGGVVKALLLDLDGVLYVGDEAVPGAAETVDWLQRAGLPHLFVTNTTSRPRSAIVAKLARMGMTVRKQDVLTPTVAAGEWLRQSAPGRPALFVPEATAADLADVGQLPADAEDGASAVVVGDLGDDWDFATLNRAFRLLMAPPHPPLVALGMTRHWRAPDGLRLDTGAFVRALEYASGATAVILGKPDAAFYNTAVAHFGLATGSVVMVGDDVRADVEGAQKAGLRGVLVRTGKAYGMDLPDDVSPDAVLDSVADLPRWWSA